MAVSPSKSVRMPALALVLAGALSATPPPAAAQISLLIVTDSCPPVTALTAAGGFSPIDTFDHSTETPTLAQLSAYDAVLAYSNDTPSDATALGDVLADYIDGGGCMTMATYMFSDDWSVEGRILDSGYAPFKKTLTENYATPSGSLTAIVPGDPIFTGVNLAALTYQANNNMADGTLDSGATLLAGDGVSVNMIARAAARPITAFNVLPVGATLAEPGCTSENNNAELYRLLANSLRACGPFFADGFELGNTSAWSSVAPLD
jgi:hypothetical protein